jgi:nucleotidyltransferase/DNA polymerase involved in DNA repair
MHRLGIKTGFDLREQTLAFLQQRFGKPGPYYYWIARGIDEPDKDSNTNDWCNGRRGSKASELRESYMRDIPKRRKAAGSISRLARRAPLGSAASAWFISNE